MMRKRELAVFILVLFIYCLLLAIDDVSVDLSPMLAKGESLMQTLTDASTQMKNVVAQFQMFDYCFLVVCVNIS
jgi:hypothetical protein